MEGSSDLINTSSILDIIEIGIFEFNENLQCIYSNKYIINYLDIKDSEQINIKNHIINNLHSDDLIIEQQKCEDFINNHIESDSICRILHKKTDNYKWIKLKRKINKKNNSSLSFLYILEDIDDLKRTESDLRESKNKAETAYNHKAIFLANMSHEIRTPLNGIIGMLTLLENTNLNSDQKDYIDMLRECSINLMTIINDILDYSKLEAGKINLDIKCIDLRNCIETTNDILLSKIYEKNIDYNYSISTSIPKLIDADSNRLKQILLNLLNNSIKFTDNNDKNNPTIFLDVSLVENDIKYPISKGDDIKIKFSVNDTGCGIEYNERDKLFKSFSQIENQLTNKINQGTGLGLAISKQLVELMDGDIWLDWSEPNKGSRFCFTIKAKSCSCSEYDEVMDDINIMHKLFRGANVFILDDKRENRLGLSEMVKKWEMIPYTYSDPKEALYFLKLNYIHFDIGFVDICMPEMDGRDFAYNLKQQCIVNNIEMIPLIALSSLGDTINNDSSQYFKAHLIKPVKESRLKKICNEILLTRQYKDKDNDYLYHSDNDKHLNMTLNKYISDNELNLNSIKDSIKVMLVEDILINQRVVISFLNKIGFKNIEIAENGKQCLEMMTTKKYDLVFLDIRMPILNGEIVIKYISDYYKKANTHNSQPINQHIYSTNQRDKEIIKNKEIQYQTIVSRNYKLLNPIKPYIVAVTAYSLKEDKEKYLSIGFDDYIPKPININDLRNCINKFIEKMLHN